MANVLHVDNGLRLARQEKYDEAIDEFTSSLSQDHTYVDAFYYRGCAYLRRCKYDKAINDFNSAISSINLSTKHELPAFYKRGYAHFKTNQFDSALDDYKLYLSHCKNHKEQNHLSHKGFFQMGVIYAALNEYDSAVSYFDQAIKDSAGMEEDGQKLYYLHRGRAYACCAKYDEAQTDLQLVLEQSTDPFIKGCAYNELGQHQDALKEFDNLFQSHRNKSKLVRSFNDHILFRRGLTYGSLHLHDHALNDFHYALDYSEQQGSSNITDRILFRKGMSHMALNNSHQAIIDFNQSTKLNENQSDVFYARGMLHYTLGRHDAAVYDQRKAMELERKSSSSTASVLKTIYYTNKFSDNRNIHIYYQNKIHEAKELLKKNKGTLKEADIHRMIAEYLQKQASYSDHPLSLYKSARGHLKEALKLSSSPVADSISLVVNNFCTAQHIAEKYPNGNAPESAINEYIKPATESILDMSRLFDQCVIKRDWSDLVAELRNQLEKSKTQRTGNFDMIRNEYIINQVQKAELMQTAMDKFRNSPEQQEFYGLLIIRLCNLFDGIRVASTGIFSHSLEGTLGKVSWIFKILGVLSEYVPVGSQYVSTVFGICGSALKKVDEIRIENALNHIGKLGTQMMFHETADEIATELTIMYENQIKRFPTTAQEKENEKANKDQQDLTTCSKCANCCKKCIRCCFKQKAGLLNEAEQSIMKIIVEYGTSIFLGYITRVEVKDIGKIKDIHNAFVNEACRPSKMTVFYTLSLSDKIKPTNPEKDDEHWDTYDFYRRPAIIFKNGTIRAQKKTDMKKFGCRKPTIEEEQWLKTTPEELDKNGFKITVDPEN
jgi:tetratricopeptide (TPR) repeat protein